ncbi:DUF4112 domain-containing protein [Lyngbya sp. PCC 8106]|uniref:DUF4112 domain-containing protein n=1 Tax=Lyngbya sp. (strain PCC 8106) TaxID=313612 RepID=UPI0000EAC276|nr:DUF4112 domain-containing protein [Lyngbya sp. PCC 8106]EAW34869.1 hypothetical protein L8106_18487 [Lyngbya sp. PCC 8106]
MNPKSSPKRSIPTTDDQSKASVVKHLRQFSNILDNAIRVPGTTYGIGLDPIIGLIPGGGDLLGGLLSAYIMLRAFRLGVPKEILVRMASNIATETLVGTVPVVGDVFDVAWKANVKNVDLLEDHVNSPQMGQKADRLFVIVLVGGLMLFILLISLVGIMILTFIYQVLRSLVAG